MVLEFIDEGKNNNSKKGDNTLLYIGLIALGAGIAYLLLKDKSSQQTVQSSQYDNDEQWHIQRGDEGFIDDVKVGRHANVGSGSESGSESANRSISEIHHNYNSNYVSLDKNGYSIPISKEQLEKYINGRIKNNLLHKIKTDSINELIGVSKTIYSDDERRRRFGMN